MPALLPVLREVGVALFGEDVAEDVAEDVFDDVFDDVFNDVFNDVVGDVVDNVFGDGFDGSTSMEVMMVDLDPIVVPVTTPRLFSR